MKNLSKLMHLNKKIIGIDYREEHLQQFWPVVATKTKTEFDPVREDFR